MKKLDSFDLKGIYSRLNTYTKAVFVRDPMERLVSAFRDKFEHPNSYYHPVFGKAIIKSPAPGDLPDSGIKPVYLMSPALAGTFFTTSTTWEAQVHLLTSFYINYLFRDPILQTQSYSEVLGLGHQHTNSRGTQFRP